MLNPKLGERFQGHYGLEYVLINDEATIQSTVIMLAKPNRQAKQDKKIRITPMWRKVLKRELAERMKIRRNKAAQRRQHIYK